MEVLCSPEYLVLQKGAHSLWFLRSTQFKYEARTDVDLNQYANLRCIGRAVLFIGQLQQDKLLLATHVQSVGYLPTVGSGNKKRHVQKLRRVCLIPLSPDVDLASLELGLQACGQHQPPAAQEVSMIGESKFYQQLQPDESHLFDTTGIIVTPAAAAADKTQQASETEAATSPSPQKCQQEQEQQSDDATYSAQMSKTWSSIKSTSSRFIGKAAATSPSHALGLSLTDARDRTNRRILDEVIKMFNENGDSFYFCENGDLTNSLQRAACKAEQLKPAQQSEQQAGDVADACESFVDERFFFNYHMLSFLDQADARVQPWLIPIVQGFVQIERCQWSNGEQDISFDIALISRRNRHRAGTRYKRRGVDDQGQCANYVETEQLIFTDEHLLSFVMTRCSVPIFWRQPGISYRPAPVLERSILDNQAAFARHFQREFKHYGGVCAINLVEQYGREKPLADAYLNHVLEFNDELLTYVSFDFHEICRGMHFENVALLVEHLADQIRDMRYCWLDKSGVCCLQTKVFRINCVDCLDRTNLVEAALAKAVLHIQLCRLGLLGFDEQLPTKFRRVFQLLWANNGDTLSRQYAGTGALKGDFTRTGERRRIQSMMKDSINSASRYYQNRFRDAYRQAAIDTLLGKTVSELDLNSPENDEGRPLGEQEVRELQEREAERLRQMVDHCRKMCTNDQEPFECWALLNAGQSECVLLLEKDCYYLIDYDDLRERIVRCQCVLLEDIERIEFGPEAVHTSLFGNASAPSSIYSMRIHYLFALHTGYFHLLRPHPPICSTAAAATAADQNTANEILRAVIQAFKLALSVRSINVPLFEGKLERRRSKRPEMLSGAGGNISEFEKASERFITTTGRRGISTNVLTRGLRTASSKAISNVSTQFARFRQKFSRGNRTLEEEEAIDEADKAQQADQAASSDDEIGGEELGEEMLDEEEVEEDELEEDELDDEDTYNEDKYQMQAKHAAHPNLMASLSASTNNSAGPDYSLSPQDVNFPPSSDESQLERQSSSECSDHSLDAIAAADARSPKKPIVRLRGKQHQRQQKQNVGFGQQAFMMYDTGDDQPRSMPPVFFSTRLTSEQHDTPRKINCESQNGGSEKAEASPDIEITPVRSYDAKNCLQATNANINNKSGLSVGRPLSRSTVQLSGAGAAVSNAVGPAATTDMPSHQQISLSLLSAADHLNSASCASIALLGSQKSKNGLRAGESSDNLNLDHFHNDQLLETVEPVELKDYTRSNLDISRTGHFAASDRLIRGLASGRMKNSQSECCIQEQPASSPDASTVNLVDADGSHSQQAHTKASSRLQQQHRLQNSHQIAAFSANHPSSSPLASKRDLIFNPFSRIARGVQQLNLNRLNPQQLIGIRRSNVHQQPQQMDEAEYERLRQRKQACRSKIIEI